MPKHSVTSKIFVNCPEKIYSVTATVTAKEKLDIEEFCERMGITQAQLIREGIKHIMKGACYESEQICAEGTEPSA